MAKKSGSTAELKAAIAEVMAADPSIGPSEIVRQIKAKGFTVSNSTIAYHVQRMRRGDAAPVRKGEAAPGEGDRASMKDIADTDDPTMIYIRSLEAKVELLKGIVQRLVQQL